MGKLNDFLSRWCHHHRRGSLVFALPTRTIRGVTVANYQLQNDEILSFRVNALDSSGTVEPNPAGDTFTLTVSDPSKLNAVLGTDAAGNTTVSVNALVRAATGITVTLTDSAGLKAADQTFDIVGDVKPIGLSFDLADATTVPQAVPPT
jgi:hypothetical protein